MLGKETLNAWIGGSDSTVEGTWSWLQTNTQFWLGKANGSATSGSYVNWKTGQPDDLQNQDCTMFQGGSGQGKWSDESCSLLRAFVCEGDLCPDDPNKTDPGVCGCGVADTDSDSDGTADCNDACPSDRKKITAGVCGCGVADTDTDGDGTADCNDQCPKDAKKIAAGKCGCTDAPKATGTACDDGMCAANTQCDGAGSCGSASQCGVPDTQCTFAIRGSEPYWVCNNNRTFAQARQRCQSVGMDLAVIDTAGENDFIKGKVQAHAFIGGSDQAQKGEWSWLRTSAQFWTGGKSGHAFGSAYTNWELLQPDDGFLGGNNCLVIDPPIGLGQWEAADCTSNQPYVCELTDLCPDDINKVDPGVCDCGSPDVDTDRDGTPDCKDECPFDPSQTIAGPLGCDVPSCRGLASDVRASVECVLSHADGSKLAVFGVTNTSGCIVDLPIGSNNQFVQAPVSRGQPTRFAPGYTRALVTPITAVLAWHLGGGTATASPTGPGCANITEDVGSPVVLDASQDHTSSTQNDANGHTATATSFQIPSQLPVTLGNAANGVAILTYHNASGALVTCTYQGGSSVATPDTDLDRARGRSYRFVSCSNGLGAGALAVGTDWSVQVLGGDPRIPLTEVQVALGSGCSGVLDPPISPEQTVSLRQGFDWAKSTALASRDVKGFPAMRYALIYLETKKQLDALRKMKVYVSQLPLFASELDRYQDKCGVLDNTGDLTGIFVYAFIPADLYNYWRNNALTVIKNNKGTIPFRAVILPPIPDAALANSDGTLSWKAMQQSGFKYLDSTSSQQPLFGWHVPILDDAIEIVAGTLVAGPIGAAVVIGSKIVPTNISVAPTLDDIIKDSVNIVEATIQEGEKILGGIDKLLNGKVKVHLDFNVLNLDPGFDLNGPMQRAWGPDFTKKIVPHGAAAEFVLWRFGVIPTRFGDDIHEDGHATITVAKHAGPPSGAGLCVHLETDAAMISGGITENEFCDFRGTSVTYAGFQHDTPTRTGREDPYNREVRIAHREFNFLTQMTDSRDYIKRVIGRDVKEAEVAVGPVANTFGHLGAQAQPFTGCFDYTSLDNTLTPVLAAVLAAAGAPSGGVGIAIAETGLIAQPFMAKDIFMPDVDWINRSRGIATHEYGHFLMCDIFDEHTGALVDLYTVRALGDGFRGEDPSHETSISMESFADFFASQVVSGANYFHMTDESFSLSMSYCAPSPMGVTGCFEKNYRGLANTEDPTLPNGFRDRIRRLVATFHDAFDRPMDDWRSQRLPTNGDAWQLDSSTGRLICADSTAAGYLEDRDDRVALPGAVIDDWIGSTNGGGVPMAEIQHKLSNTMASQGYNWCDICQLFAQHDPDLDSTSASQQAIWQECAGSLAGIVGGPPEPSLRLDATSCRPCGPRQYSDGNGHCTSCAGDRDRVVGNACVSCPSGSIVTANDTCIACAASEITSGNSCSRCPSGQTPDPTMTMCLDCPVNIVMDLGVVPSTDACPALDVGVDPAVVVPPNSVCPFVLDVIGLSGLAAGGPKPSNVQVAAFSYRDYPDHTSCEISDVVIDATTQYFGNYSILPTSVVARTSGQVCSEVSCQGNCKYYFHDVLSSVDSQFLGQTGVDQIRVSIDTTTLPNTRTALSVASSLTAGCPPPI